jgi:peptidyl-tRNA hydrolase
MIIPNMPMAEYQARPEVSSHDLKLIHKAPFAYRYAKDQGIVEEDDMCLGSLLHLAVLEPDKLENEVAIVPEDAPRKCTKAQLKAIAEDRGSDIALESFSWWNDWQESTKGKANVSASDLEKVRAMHKSLMATPTVRNAIAAKGLREATAFFEYEGVACRMRPDIWCEDEMIDLKSTGDTDRKAFIREIWSKRYHTAASFYGEGAKALGRPIKRFSWVTIETKAPHLCAVHIAHANLIEFARIENVRDLQVFKDCTARKFWPGVRQYPEAIELPTYAE